MLVLALLQLTVGQALAQDIEYGAELAAANRYGWRGIAVIDEPSIQPSLWGGVNGWQTVLWANLSPGETEVLDEVDLIVGYSAELGPVSLVPGAAIYLVIPEPDYSTAELTLEISVTAGPILLGLEQSVDMVLAPRAWWGRATAGVELEPTESLWVTARVGPSMASASWNEEVAVAGEAGGVDTLHADAEVGYALGEAWSVAARAEIDRWLLASPPSEPWVPTVALAVGWAAGGD